MRLFSTTLVVVLLVFSSTVEAKPLQVRKQLLQSILNTWVSNHFVRFHKKWVKYRFPKLGVSGKGRLSALYFRKRKVKLQFYKLSVKTFAFDLSSFPLIRIKVRFKTSGGRARAIKAEYKVAGKMVDWILPDILWRAPRMEATARLSVVGGKLSLSGYRFRFFGTLALNNASSFKGIRFSVIQNRLKPYICRHVDQFLHQPLRRKIDRMLNLRLRQLCGNKRPHNIRLHGGKLRADCG